ncbi:MAG TPA: YibE/F family protein [Spirochaetota bacterium]|nr:YibE/F family protein [Spirochaetota bacterium]HPS87036.1 YibE/F family protein [Spirochaetota bacterium]
MSRFIKLLISSVLILFTFSTSLSAVEKKLYNEQRTFARALVEKIEHVEENEDNPYDVMVRIHLKILDGVKKGEKSIVEFKGDDNMPKGMFYMEGDTVFVGISKLEQSKEIDYISIYDVENTKGIVILGVLLLISIIAVGRLRGVLSMASLVSTIFLLFYLLVPLTLKGKSPIPMAVGISLFAIVVTIPIILGFQKKTLAAIIGASSGVLIATLLALGSGWILRLTGIVTNEMMTVFYASSIDIDLKGLALSGIIISALGAIMDVCISIASATEEIFRVHPEISFKEAFKSVVTVSSDMLGATMNTLLFAYVGTSLPLVLLIALKLEPGLPFAMVLNYNPVLSELVQSAIGCIGMFLSMPATALICIELHMRSRKNGKTA